MKTSQLLNFSTSQLLNFSNLGPLILTISGFYFQEISISQFLNSSIYQFINFPIFKILVKFWSNFGQFASKCWRFQAFLFSPPKWSKIEEEEKVAYFSQFPSFFFKDFLKIPWWEFLDFFAWKLCSMMRAIHLWAFWNVLGAFWVVFGDFSKKFPTFFYSIQHLSLPKFFRLQ